MSASITPASLAATAEKLRTTRAELLQRPAFEIVAALGAAGARFLDARDPLRQEALELLPASSGLSEAMCEKVLDGMAADWTTERLTRLLTVELGDPATLDRFVSVRGRTAMAVGPALCVQIVAGTVPGVSVTAVIRSLLVKGPTLLRPGRGDTVLPRLFLRALAEADAALARSLAVADWDAPSDAHLDAALSRADVVTAYGSDETVRRIRNSAPVTTRVVPYHHRISVGIVGRAALRAAATDDLAAEVAESAATFDQRGCVCPQAVYVETGGEVTPAAFADRLADALAVLESRLPSGLDDGGRAAVLQQARGIAELLVGGRGGYVRHGRVAPWTVVYEPAPGSPIGGVGRFVRVIAIRDVSELQALLAPLGAHLQTVGVAGLEDRLDEVARSLAAIGASRVVPFGSVAFPPAWWHHDGRGPLLDLIRWADLERPDDQA